ncbi:glycosyltransferase [Qipengyuania sphaerica]|uniref:glycosyltransferase n=1 Tax=Qipengyuania sphaerica TaxID=2867243 RepID=UPI001C878343|nr:glycosyltransferase [Qipengyuania sphaerica]
MKTRLLVVSSAYEPFVIGGAEQSARTFCLRLQQEGYEIAILTTSPSKNDEVWGEVNEDGMKVYRVMMPRPYTLFDRSDVSPLDKARYHLADHFAPFNPALANRVIADFKPDLVNIHAIQGLGHNSVKAYAKAGLPVVYTLHDQGLACINMSRFRDGKLCEGQCTACRFSSKVKTKAWNRTKRLSFISPSRANLETVAQFVPEVAERPAFAIGNPNSYPVHAPGARSEGTTNLLFVGRLHSSKGVDIAIEALLPLATAHRFKLRLLGTGPDEAELKQRYDSLDWVSFDGFVSMEEVGEAMGWADVLLVPSTWQENFPGVIQHAQQSGLPVMASRIGGLPEMVDDRQDGLLVAPGDVAAWKGAFENVLSDAGLLEHLAKTARERASLQSPQALSEKIEEVLALTIDPDRPATKLGAQDRVFPR